MSEDAEKLRRVLNEFRVYDSLVFDEIGGHTAMAAFERIEADNERLRAALRELSTDMHMVSKRPCFTCSKASAALGEPFGCEAYAASALGEDK